MKNLLTNMRAMLRRYKVASALNIVGLAVAFAAFTVIMMQVHYDLSYERFHENSERIFRFEPNSETGYRALTDRPMARELTSLLPQIERGGIVASPGSMILSADEQNFVEHKSIYYTPEIVRMFDFRVVAGDTARLHEPATVMLSRSVADKLFPHGKDPIGRQLSAIDQRWGMGGLRTESVEVVAVCDDVPDNSMFAGAVLTEMHHDFNGNYNSWGAQNFNFFLQIDPRDRAAVEQAINSYIASSPNIPENLVSTLTPVRLTPAGDLHLQNDVAWDSLVAEKANRSTVYILLSIAILIIVIAAINFVNFAISMVPTRLKGINMKRVLGSSVWAIRRSMTGEAVGLTLIALVVALFLVYGLSTSSLGGFTDIDLAFGKHIPVLALTALVALAVGVLAGIYPAFYIASFRPAMVLKGSFALSPHGKKLRTALISVQYVISIALIVAALFIQAQNRFMKNYPLGFEKDNILTANISLDLAGRNEALKEELVKNSSIVDVAFSRVLLVATDGMPRWSMPNLVTGEPIGFSVLPVSNNFPAFMGLEVTGGRDFLPGDGEAFEAFIFNDTGREALSLPEGAAIGADPRREVVGFVRDFHFKPLHYGVEPMALGIIRDRGGSTYHRLRQAYIRVVAGADIAGTIDYIEKTIRTMDPSQVDVSVDFLDAAIGNLYAKETRLANLITTFSMLAVFISIIGVFGLVLFETQYRRREIGIRKVHGASVGNILRLFNTNFVRIVAGCFVVAAPVAWYFVMQWQRGFAFRTPVQWWIFVAALASVLAVTMFTVTLQSYRAAIENPVNSITFE